MHENEALLHHSSTYSEQYCFIKQNIVCLSGTPAMDSCQAVLNLSTNCMSIYSCDLSMRCINYTP